MANTDWTFDAAGFTPSYEPRYANWSVQATVVGTGAVTADISVQVSNDDVGYVEITTFTLTDTDLATNIATVQSAYKYVRAEVEAITGTGAVCTITIHNKVS